MAEQFQYNKAFDQRLFGRETKKPADTAPPKEPDKPPPPPPETPKEKDPPEYTITEASIDVPSDGIKINSPYYFCISVKPLGGKITRTRIWVDSWSLYNGTKERIDGQQNLNLDPDTNSLSGSFKSCWLPHSYYDDDKKPADATFELYLVVNGTGADKEYQGASIKLPMPTKDVILKKGTYDASYANAQGTDKAKYPESGENFIPDNKVWKLQKFLIDARYLKPGEDTGFFDDKTEAAVLAFQNAAKADKRKVRGECHVQTLDKNKIKYTETPDGVDGPNTDKEIAVWTQCKYVKPDEEILNGHFDNSGVQNGKGNKGDYKHLPGNAVSDFQKLLKDIGANPGQIDGWAADKTFVALKHVQDCADKGKIFDQSGNPVKLEVKDKLTGHRDNVGDQAIIDWMKKLFSQYWVVAPQVDYYGGYELQKDDNDEKKKWGGKDIADKTGSFVTDLQKDLIELGFLAVDKPTGNYGPKTEEAVKNFQDAATKTKRSKDGKEVETKDVFKGKATGKCDKDTAAEITKWKENGWKAPLQSDIFEGINDTEEFSLMIATIYGEAGGCSETAWKAVANVIMNRLSTSGCIYYTKAEYKKSVTTIIDKTGFDAHTQKIKPYVNAANYLSGAHIPPDVKINRMAEVIKPIYLKTKKDISDGAVLYYSPKTQAKFHETNPSMYAEKPRWNFDQLQEVIIPDLASTDDFKFYKYK